MNEYEDAWAEEDQLEKPASETPASQEAAVQSAPDVKAEAQTQADSDAQAFSQAFHDAPEVGTEPAPAKSVETAQPTDFKSAFAKARKDGLKTFDWNGKKYSTDLASDKKNAPLERAVAPVMVIAAVPKASPMLPEAMVNKTPEKLQPGQSARGSN